MLPWKQVYDVIKQVVTLSQETQKNKSDIKQVREELDALTEEVKGMRQELRDFTFVVQRIAYDVQATRNNTARDQENLALRLENQLKFERRPPPLKANEETRS